MPDPSGAILGAVQNVPSDIQAASAADIQNRRSQKFAEEMYDRQRADALEFWNMQNTYNSPVEQMRRYKEAGLNPALIYGQGNSGPAGSVQVPDVTRPEFREPRIEGGKGVLGLLASADLRIKNAQANNLEVQTEVIRQDAELRRLQVARTDFDLGFDRNLVEVSADARRERLRQLKIQNDVAIDRNAREAAQSASSLKEAAYRMLNLEQQNRNMRASEQHTYTDIERMKKAMGVLERTGKLQDIEIALRKRDINPNDPMYQRYVAKILQDFGDMSRTMGAPFNDATKEVEKFINETMDWINNLWKK